MPGCHSLDTGHRWDNTGQGSWLDRNRHYPRLAAMAPVHCKRVLGRQHRKSQCTLRNCLPTSGTSQSHHCRNLRTGIQTCSSHHLVEKVEEKVVVMVAAKVVVKAAEKAVEKAAEKVMAEKAAREHRFSVPP